MNLRVTCESLLDPACGQCGCFLLGSSNRLLEEDVTETCVLSDKTKKTKLVTSVDENGALGIVNQPKRTIGGRRRRADIVRSVYNNPTVLRACHNVRLECVTYGEEPLFNIRRIDMWKDHKVVHKPKEVLVAVEATHICQLDVGIRRGLLDREICTPFVPGSNFVGIVHDGALPKGTRVAGFTKIGGNARYVSVSPEVLCIVPRRLASCEVVCVLSSYFPALQALRGANPRNHRQNFQETLEGKSILLTEGASIVEIEAMVQLASLAGAQSINVICESVYHAYVQNHLGANAMHGGAGDWLLKVEGMMDVIIDYGYSENRIDIPTALSPSGRLVSFSYPSIPANKDILQSLQKCLHHASLFSLNTALPIHSPFEGRELHQEESKEDLKFLFHLLRNRKIRPKIDRYITLESVRQAHVDIQNGEVFGAIICEPWKEK